MSVGPVAVKGDVALTIGRFQAPDPADPGRPRLHTGHVALLRAVLDEGKRVVVLLRVGLSDEANPYTYGQRAAAIRAAFPAEYGRIRFTGSRFAYEQGTRLHVLPVPDTEDVFHGRDCPWAERIRRIRLPDGVEAVSGTALRERACG